MGLEGSRGRRQGSCVLDKRFRIYPGGQELANYGPQINSDLLPVSIVLLEHGQAHSFMDCLWLILYLDGRVE